MKKKKSNGMILITTMLFISIIIMIATLIAVQGKAALQNGSLTLQTEEAYLTALSGIEYVRGELRKSQTFGTKTLLQTPPQIPGLIVEYSDRNLTGYLGGDSKDNCKSKFSISFANPKQITTTNVNYKHTSSECKYLSVNNLNSSTETTVSDLKFIRRNVPAGSIYVVSKGVCGKAVRYAEAFLTSDSSPSVDGGSAIGGNVTITGTADNYGYDADGGKNESNSLLTITHVDTNKPGKLIAFDSDGKANNNIELTSGDKNIYDLLNLNNQVVFNGKLNEGEQTPDPRDDKDKDSNLKVVPGVDVDRDDLNSLDYQEAKNYVGECSYDLTPGTYLYIREPDIKDGICCWKYLALENPILEDGTEGLEYMLNNQYNEYVRNDLPSNGGINFGSVVTLTDEEGKEISSYTRTVNLYGNVHSSGNVNFAIVDKQLDGTYKFVDSSIDFKVNGGSLVCKGDIYIDGEVVGHGNLVSNGNITFNAGSNLEVDPNQKVAVWANRDVNIKRATNLSNDSLVQIFQDEYNANNENSTVPGSDTLNVNPVSDVQINRLLTGVTGDKVREEVKLEDILAEWEVKDWGFTAYNSSSGYFSFKFKGHSFKVLTNRNEGYITVLFDGGNSMNVYDDINSSDYSKYFTVDGAKVYFTRRWGNENDGITNDFNIFINVNDKYYLYKSINVNTGGGAFGGELENNPGILGNIDIVTGWPPNTHTRTISTCGVYPETYGGATGNLMTTLYQEQIANNGGGSSQSSQQPTTTQAEINTENALIASIINSDTKLRGTVYSREGKININIGNTDFAILGALITLNGNLEITAAHVNFQYDPKYVPFFKDSAGIQTNVQYLSSFVGGE